MRRQWKTLGFTLVELMIVVAVIAIIAAIAYPAFTEQMRRSRRSEAVTGLQQIQLLQEKYRANKPTYGTVAQIGANATSERGYYAFTITNNTATGFVATAAAQGVQLKDTKCLSMTLTYAAGTTTKGSTTGLECWN
ncbi:type IV pilin protein [Tahibacter amnicola]|uniref:Type IV pilin protein n=1 Tax=Tahibacter amnicola TaxID=2976241 RepID=A0ABY6BKW6_9GAMM|nr:type IV pilin protein [Tahibacter amnicola]UXI69680.1 type IV pilin protein [Tahibacter amnicola]